MWNREDLSHKTLPPYDSLGYRLFQNSIVLHLCPGIGSNIGLSLSYCVLVRKVVESGPRMAYFVHGYRFTEAIAAKAKSLSPCFDMGIRSLLPCMHVFKSYL